MKSISASSVPKPQVPDVPLASTTCCSPSRERALDLREAQHELIVADTSERKNAVAIPGGTALVGTDAPCLPQDGEGPLRKRKIKPFRIGVSAVTNEEFDQFVSKTGYVTEAEKYGWSFVFHAQVPKALGATRAVAGLEWWRQIEGASWRDVNGPGTAGEAWRPDHPVVHVSWNDANAYAAWAGGRLPSEVEWEHAARGGLGDVRFPWGDEEPDEISYLPCNIWQGQFPKHNTAADGYQATAPAISFAPNGYGLYNMVGNVWEWTADPYRVDSLKRSVRERMKSMQGHKLSKGGSFLCHVSYCYRYRIAARSGSTPNSTTTHHGFRVVWPA